MSLPPLGSIDPADTIKRACVVWAHSESIPCEKCGKPALVGLRKKAPLGEERGEVLQAVWGLDPPEKGEDLQA